MTISKAIMAICLATTLSHSMQAASTKFTFGAIDRVTGGRDYIMNLSSIQSNQILIRSSSTVAGAKVKIREVIYSDGIEAISVNQEGFFTNAGYKTIFDVEKLATYETVEVPEACKGPCLVINAEGFAADDNQIEVAFESKDEGVFAVSLQGLSPRSFPAAQPPVVIIDDSDDQDMDQDQDQDMDQDPVIVDRTGTDMQYRVEGFVLELKKFEPNADGSVTISRPQLSQGANKLPIYPVPAAREKICQVVMNSQAAYALDWNVRKNRGKPSFYVNADDSLEVTNADYVLKTVTCY